MATIKPQLAYAGITLTISLIFTIQYSVDVLSVKHYFPPEIAGLYAGISTISNIIFFATGSVYGVLLATIKIGSPANKNLLRRSMLLMLLLGGGAFAVFSLFPKTVIHILIGKTYVPYAHFLPSISFALFLITFANLFFVYHLAQRAYAISYIALGGALITYLLIITNHASIQAVINNVITGSALLLVGISCFSFIKRRAT